MPTSRRDFLLSSPAALAALTLPQPATAAPCPWERAVLDAARVYRAARQARSQAARGSPEHATALRRWADAQALLESAVMG